MTWPKMTRPNMFETPIMLNTQLVWPFKGSDWMKNHFLIMVKGRPAQLAELPRSVFDPELFPHSAYVKFFVTFATKVPYLTFCDKM